MRCRLEGICLKLIGSFKTTFTVAAIVTAVVGSSMATAVAADGSAEPVKANDTAAGASSESDSTKGLPTKDGHAGIQPGSPAEKLKGHEEFPPDVVIPAKNSKGGKETTGAAALKDIKKQAAKAPDQKAFFKVWFEKFYSAMYYAKTLDEMKPYFASRMTKTWDHLDVAPKARMLETIKQMRATNTSITEFTKFPTGYYEMTVQGQMVSMGEKGNGATHYRLVNEGGSWKIENFKGKAWARPRYYQD